MTVLLLTSCQKADSDELIVAVAANMQFVVQELNDAYEIETGHTFETVISSSGKLTAQITEGAPFDVFVSADVKYPNELFDNGFTQSKPTVYAYGRLVLWSTVKGVMPELNALHQENIKHIALANPETAPYGQAAKEAIEYYGIDNIEDKLVFGESISQTNQFVVSRAATVGFTAKSVVLSPQMKNVGQWVDIDQHAHTPLAQAMVILKTTDDKKEQAQLFHDFLLSETAKKILIKFGYTVNE